MKKQITALILVFACLLTMSGCATASAVQKLDVVEEKVEGKLEAVEERLETKLDAVEDQVEAKLGIADDRAADVPATEHAAVAEKHVQPVVPSGMDNLQQISKEDAQVVALNYVGLSADQVTRLRTEYEIDDRVPQYDVEFRQGNLEYEFEIHAENGTIISFDKDYD